MNIKHLLGVCALAASMALATAGSASALIYEQVYTGTVTTSSAANGGLFGGLSGGEAFTVRFVTDTSRGSGVIDIAGGQKIEGGDNSHTTAPVSVFFNINGHAYSFVDDIAGSSVKIESIGGQLNVVNSLVHYNNVDYVEIQSTVSGPDLGHPAGFGQPYEISSFVGSPFLFFLGHIDDRGFYAEMNITSAYGRVISGVPEPATWALMMSGFAGLGGALRANRRRVATA